MEEDKVIMEAPMQGNTQISLTLCDEVEWWQESLSEAEVGLSFHEQHVLNVSSSWKVTQRAPAKVMKAFRVGNQGYLP